MNCKQVLIMKMVFAKNDCLNIQYLAFVGYIPVPAGNRPMPIDLYPVSDIISRGQGGNLVIFLST